MDSKIRDARASVLGRGTDFLSWGMKVSLISYIPSLEFTNPSQNVTPLSQTIGLYFGTHACVQRRSAVEALAGRIVLKHRRLKCRNHANRLRMPHCRIGCPVGPHGGYGISKDLDIQKELHRAIATLQLAQEILARLTVSQDSSIRLVLRARAEALGNRLTETELEVITGFIEGQSPETIAGRRGLSERTISNQLRTGCHKLGFSDRRELKGWGSAVSGFLVTRPPRDSLDLRDMDLESRQL